MISNIQLKYSNYTAFSQFHGCSVNNLGLMLNLEKLGGYRKDRRAGVEGLTLAGLMMFGTGQAIREKFDNIFMDYRNE